MIKFDSVQQLTHWLSTHGILIDTWGKGDAKTVSDLWQEMSYGETTLQLLPEQNTTQQTPLLVRLVQVVELLIKRQDYTLLEAGQLLNNGAQRHRNHLPAEKMKADETPLAAAWRCLREELTADDEILEQVVVSIVENARKERMSPSYPGLRTEYLLYRAEVSGLPLPTEDFSTDNRAYNEGDPVKTHYWHWTKETK